MPQLTKAERDTLNAAMEIIFANTPKGSHWMLSAMNYNGKPAGDVCYFDSNKTQHSNLWSPDCTFADKIQKAVDIEAYAEANAQKAHAFRIESLRKQLATLTGEAA